MFFIDKKSTKFIQSPRGFTLIELIVSIFIMVLLSASFLTNYHSSNKRSKLSLAAQKLVSNIRLMQSYSLGSVKNDGNVPNGGWGLYFNKTVYPRSYIIFTDDHFPLSPNYLFDAGEEYEEIELPPNVTLSHAGDFVNIVFEPPEAITHINNSVNSGSVNIELADDESTRTVLVNFFGLVDIID